jgi:hypothetical protein
MVERYHAFLCHHRKGKPAVLEFERKRREKGIEPRLDKADLQGGVRPCRFGRRPSAFSPSTIPSGRSSLPIMARGRRITRVQILRLKCFCLADT